MGRLVAEAIPFRQGPEQIPAKLHDFAELQWRDMLGWLWYPVIYLAWTFVHGALSGFYPYPFLNTEVLGLGRVLLNELGLLAVFLVLGMVLISFGRLGVTSKSPIR